MLYYLTVSTASTTNGDAAITVTVIIISINFKLKVF